MTINVKIEGYGTYHPPLAVQNEYFFEKFDPRGQDVRALLKSLGRETRYFIENEDENVLTMGIVSAKRAIENAGITAEDIDMIVFISETPEYTAPSNALKIHQAIGATNARITYDMNTNCIGMLLAMDMVSKYMKSTPDIKRALIVASLHISHVVDSDHPVMSTCYNDGSGSLILRKEEDVAESAGVIDLVTKVDSSLHDKIELPKAGMTKVMKGEAIGLDAKFKFIDHSVEYFSVEWKKLIDTILEKNNLSKDDVGLFLFQQFNQAQNIATLDKLGIKPADDNYVFVGDKVGYTGSSCIVFALEEAVKRGEFKQGQYVLFVSVSVGYTMAVTLYRV